MNKRHHQDRFLKSLWVSGRKLMSCITSMYRITAGEKDFTVWALVSFIDNHEEFHCIYKINYGYSWPMINFLGLLKNFNAVFLNDDSSIRLS